MGIAVGSWRAWALAVLLAWALPAAADEPLPFVNAGGVVGTELRRSAVLRALGAPAAEGASHALAYPAQGLLFTLDGEAGSDPPVRQMLVRAPSRATTPGGLHVGMAQAPALEILHQDYRVVATEPGPPLRALRVAERDGRGSPATLEVGFEGGVVSRLSFEPPRPPPGAHRPAPRLPSWPLLAVAAMALVASLLFDRLARAAGYRRWQLPQAAVVPLGGTMAAVGVLLVAVFWPGMRSGDPMGRLGPFVLVAGGGCLLVVAAAVLARAASRWIAWPARLALGLLLAWIVAERLGWL